MPNNSLDAGRIIRSVPILARLAEADIRDLSRRGKTHAYAPGDIIFREGDPGDSLHVIVDGDVAVTVVSSEGVEALLARFGPGDCFGELALLDGLPRSGTARALQATRTFVVARGDFTSWLDSRPAAARALLETLSLRLRRTSEQMTDRMFLGLPGRLVKELLNGEPGPGPRTIIRTQAELGAVLGVSREAVNKALRALERQGLLVLGRGRVTVPDPSALLRLV